MRHPTLAVALAAAILMPLLSLTPAEAAPSRDEASQDGTLVTVTPARVLDTRTGTGVTTGGLHAGTSIAVQILGRGQVPATHVSAVVLNITAVAPTKATYLTVYPEGTPPPSSSSLNVAPGETRANATTISVGEEGKIRIANATGTTHVVVDIVGYYQTDGATAAGSNLYLTSPARILDTRQDGRPLPAQEGTFVDFDFGSAALNTDAKAVAVTITVATPRRNGYLVAWDGVAGQPNTSNLNFMAGQTTANSAIISVSACGDFCIDPDWRSMAIRNVSPGETNVLIDLVGVYADSDIPDGALKFSPTPPTRIVDTRQTGQGPRLRAQETRLIRPGFAADGDTDAIAANVTAVAATSSTYLTIFDHDPRPATSTINTTPGRATASSTIIRLAAPAQDAFTIFNNAGTVDVAIDISGRFLRQHSARELRSRRPTRDVYGLHGTRQRKL